MLQPEVWAALTTLTVLEIVLGIDNIIFISILTEKLPQHQRAWARRIGLTLAMVSRIALLFSLSFIMSMTKPWLSVFSHQVSGRDLVLILGGLFLLYKATREIHEKIEGGGKSILVTVPTSFAATLVQITILDLVFSLDSVITAVGMANELWIMVTAIVIAIGFMMWTSRALSAFIHRHPTVQMLALGFLLLIGAVLISDGFGHHVPKGYIYFAMAFSVLVEALNLLLRHKQKPQDLPEIVEEARHPIPANDL
jgi:predicted tellurium resistance membrane protein TerC